VGVGLVACNGDGSSSTTATATQVSIQGTITGLGTGQSVVLELNGSNPLRLEGDGAFAFTNAGRLDDSYDVTVITQPIGAVCTIANGSGAGLAADVTDLAVTCTAHTYTIAGQLSGLPPATQVVLENNGADALTRSSNGGFSFPTPVDYDGSFAVTIATQPTDATCSVSGASGAGVTADVSSVSVICSVNSYPIGGTLSGLANGAQVTLQNNGADALALGANGSFTFPTQVAAGGAFNVTVASQPVGQTCSVSGGQGSNLDSDVSNVSVSCSVTGYSIGGTVSGLTGGHQITLDNNGADPLIITTNGTFRFDTPVTEGGSYDVTVGTQPTGQSCQVSNGSHANVSADVTSVTVSCVTSYTTPGTYSFTVPDGVSSLQIIATGGGGGGGGASGQVYAGPLGGAGATVTSTLSVTAGQVLSLVVGGGGHGGISGGGTGTNYTCGSGAGGGGASSVDAGDADQIIAGGGGGGGACVSDAAGGDAGGPNGAGGSGGAGDVDTAAFGGADGTGGTGAAVLFGSNGNTGGSGDGGAGGEGGNNGPMAGGAGGSGSGTASGGDANAYDLAGGGGGGYGGGGSGASGSGGGAGGSIGPSGTTYAAAVNGGAAASNGGDGSILITSQ